MHFEHLEEENYTWFDVVLDGAQLILDIVGTVAPAPIGTVANGINAAVSLSRGDYVGAATSAAMCAASLIPGGTIALGSGKLAKAAKAVTGTVLQSQMPPKQETNWQKLLWVLYIWLSSLRPLQMHSQVQMLS